MSDFKVFAEHVTARLYLACHKHTSVTQANGWPANIVLQMRPFVTGKWESKTIRSYMKSNCCKYSCSHCNLYYLFGNNNKSGGKAVDKFGEKQTQFTRGNIHLSQASLHSNRFFIVSEKQIFAARRIPAICRNGDVSFPFNCSSSRCRAVARLLEEPRLNLRCSWDVLEMFNLPENFTLFPPN